MHRRDVLRAGAGVGVGAVVGCLGGAGGPALHEGFEDGLGEWTADASIGAEVDPGEFEWTVEVSEQRAAGGTRSLRIENEGDHDDGTTWAVRSIPVRPDRAYRVSVTAQFWSESESFNTLRDAVIRIGPEPPVREEDFPRPGMNTSALEKTPYGGLREPLWLAAGWREYAFEWTTPVLSTDTLHVAVGTSVIWESTVEHFVDELAVEFEPR